MSSSKVRNLLSSERGAFSVYAAIAFPIFLAMLGFGLDYWSTLSVKARLDAAADDAAIAGAKAAVAYMMSNPSNLTGDALTAAAETVGDTAAKQAFSANAGATLVSNPMTPSVVHSYAAPKFTYTVSFSGTRNTSFANLVGVSGLGLGGSSTATQSRPTWVNVYVLVDASQSMGIAANQSQMTALYNASLPYNPDMNDYGRGVGCVFGCHVAQGTSISMEQVAHNNNILLRIDVARAAIANMAQVAQANAVVSNIQFAVYQMQQDPSTGSLLNQVYPASGLTSDYAALGTAMGPNSYVLDLGNNTSGGIGDSNQSASLAQFAQNMTAQGDGSSAASPLNYVFVVTDGAIDTPGACTDGHCTQVIPSTACDAIKTKGATVGVIYTTYINIYAKNDPNQGLDNRFSALVQPFLGMIPGNLKSCSSGAGWYYEATDDTQLLNDMNQLFQSTLTLVRLTN